MTTLEISRPHSLKETAFHTANTWSPLILRVFLGAIIFPHGAQKLFGWFGGFGFSGTMDYFMNTVGLPWIISFAVILLESIGAIALIAGFATRFISVSYVFLAIGIILSSHIQHGFFMNWYGHQAGEGFEYFLLWIAIALCLTITGAGKYSIDKNIIMAKTEA